MQGRLKLADQKTNTEIAKEVGGKLWQFGLGLITELAGGAKIDKCLPVAWKNSTPAEDEKEEKGMGEVAKERTVWETIKKVLLTTVDIACLIKDFKTSLVKYASKLFKVRRRFIEGTSEKWSFKGFFTEGAAKMKDIASKVANGTIKVSKDILKTVGETKEKIEAALKEALSKVFEPVIENFQKIKDKFLGLFKSETIKKIKVVLECLINLGKAAYNLYMLATNISQIVGRLSVGEPVAIVSVIIGLICSYKAFIIMINYLLGAYNETGDKRWNYLGKFFGKLLNTIGNIDFLFATRRLY
jgi:hypothetical protein